MDKSGMSAEERGARKFRADPSLGRGWGGPFNGQGGRCLIFAQLVQVFRPDVIIETGTYRGTTTEWMAAFQLPIHSIESEPESFGFSAERFKATRNVALVHGDSRPHLRRLLGEVVPADACVLAYLDAHWEDDLPLGEELEIVFGDPRRTIVMVGRSGLRLRRLRRRAGADSRVHQAGDRSLRPRCALSAAVLEAGDRQAPGLCRAAAASLAPRPRGGPERPAHDPLTPVSPCRRTASWSPSRS